MLPEDPAPPRPDAGLAVRAGARPTALPAAPSQARPAAARPSWRSSIALVAILAGGALFMSGYLVGLRRPSSPARPAGRAEAFQPFWDTYQTIERRYAGGDIDEQALVRGRDPGHGRGARRSRTPRTSRRRSTSRACRTCPASSRGSAPRSGRRAARARRATARRSGRTARSIVVSPIEGSPAEKAGLLAGRRDRSRSTARRLDGLTVDAARDKIRGKKGTEVVLTIKRGEAAAFDVTIVRDVIAQQEVIRRTSPTARSATSG